MKRLLSLALPIIGIVVLSTVANAQRDFLTKDEVEIVRDTQRIDERIDVLIKAMDRRFESMAIDVSAPKTKDRAEWGPKPEGTRSELLVDVKRIMQKAIDDIDNLADRPNALILNPDDSGKKGMTHHELFGKAVRNLAAAAKRYDTKLRPVLANTSERLEAGPLGDILEMCEQIIAALDKLPKSGK